MEEKKEDLIIYTKYTLSHHRWADTFFQTAFYSKGAVKWKADQSKATTGLHTNGNHTFQHWSDQLSLRQPLQPEGDSL